MLIIDTQRISFEILRFLTIKSYDSHMIIPDQRTVIPKYIGSEKENSAIAQ